MNQYSRPNPSVRLLSAMLLSGVAGAVHGTDAAPGPATTAAATTVPAGAESEQRMRQDLQAALSHMAESGALGPHPERVSLRVDEPARRIVSLGALVDSTSAQSAGDGLHVLGTTPGSTADRLGLQAGDVITAVNGTSLRGLGADNRGRALAATTLRSVVDTLPDSAAVSVEVTRQDRPLKLNAAMRAVYVPAMHVALGDAAAAATVAADSSSPGTGSDGCGRISTFEVAPRGERLYAARILLLDGSTPGPSGTPSFRVAPGEHRLLVAENIPTQALGVGEIATRRRQTSKALTVMVHAGQTALVAAQLHLDKTTELNHGGYWDPVVWKEISEPCR